MPIGDGSRWGFPHRSVSVLCKSTALPRRPGSGYIEVSFRDRSRRPPRRGPYGGNPVEFMIDAIQEYGELYYVVVFVWTFLEGETFVIFSGVAAREGLLDIYTL